MQSDAAIKTTANASALMRWITHFRITTLPTLVSVFFAMAAALLLRAYQFGESNHNVYLLDGLRQATDLLSHDWFTTQTLQYHAAFSKLVKLLYEQAIIARAFLWLHLATLFFFHLCWCKIVLRLGGTRTTFMLSVALFYLSAGGLGLGVYEFMQDRSFLPSNVANVSMLWGIYFWMTRRAGWSGVCLAIAGIAHLNHAIVAILLWGCLIVGLLLDDVPAHRQWRKTLLSKPLIVGSAILFICCTANILLALIAMWPKRDGLPFDEFINLYVRLRHPHHYDPSSWPLVLWISFLWPIPLALLAYHRRNRAPAESQYAWTQAGRVCIVISILTLIALIFAGLTYISDTLVKLSLFRFSIYLKLFTCVGAAWIIYPPHRRAPKIIHLFFICAVAVAMAAVLKIKAENPFYLADFIRPIASYLWPIFGLLVLAGAWLLYRCLYPVAWPWCKCLLDVVFIAFTTFMIWSALHISYDQNARVEIAMPSEVTEWVQHNTPTDAVFLVPPHNENFRLHARRAVVVNFKGVAQLNEELAQWRDRMQDVLDLPNLAAIRRADFFDTLQAIRARFYEVDAAHLVEVAHRYGAQYIILEREMPESLGTLQYLDRSRLAWYYIYKLNPRHGPIDPVTPCPSPTR